MRAPEGAARRMVPTVLVVALLVGGSAPRSVEAQQRRGEQPNREQIEQRIRAQMGRIMQERLELDDDQAERLSEVVQSFDAQRRELVRQEFAARRQVDDILDSGGDESEARALLERQADLRLEEARLFRAEQEALLELLSPAQVLELQDLRQDIGRRIRALRGGGRPDQDRSRGAGPRPDDRIGGGPMQRERPAPS